MGDVPMFAVGFVMAFIVALIAIKTFLQLIKRISFIPFAIYRFIVAAAVRGLLLRPAPSALRLGQRCSFHCATAAILRRVSSSRISAPLKPAATTSLVETDCATSGLQQQAPLRVIAGLETGASADVGFAGERDLLHALRFAPRVNAVEEFDEGFRLQNWQGVD